MTRTRRILTCVGALAVATMALVVPTATAAASVAPAHQTLKTIAASVTKAKASDAKASARALAAAPSSTATDLAAAQAAAANTVAKANAGVQAAVANHDTGLWGDIATLYQATAAQTAIDQVATDLSTPPPPVTTTTTTRPPTTTTTAPVTTTTTQPPTTTTTQPNAPPAGVVGLYVGSVSSATSLGKTLGLNPLKGYSYYCDGTSWSSIASCAPAGGLPAGTTLLVGVDLTPNKTGLTAVAANVNTFSTLAKHFVGTNVIFRVGWEFDGSWMPWGTGANGNTPQEFASATALVLPAMKAADPTAQFDFSDNTGTSTLAQLKVYMGNNAALWTYVGGDHYADKGSTTASTMSALTASVTLASQLNKPFSEGEWGLNGTDNPKWIAAECQVITNPTAASAANNWPSYTVGPTSYFSADLQINSDITQFPNSVAAYKADCG